MGMGRASISCNTRKIGGRRRVEDEKRRGANLSQGTFPKQKLMGHMGVRPQAGGGPVFFPFIQFAFSGMPMRFSIVEGHAGNDGETVFLDKQSIFQSWAGIGGRPAGAKSISGQRLTSIWGDREGKRRRK